MTLPCVRTFRAARGAKSAARCPTMRPLRRSVPAHAGTRASAWSSCAATSRSSTVAPAFVPDQGLAGAPSAAPCAFSPARWSQGWSLIARSIAPAGQARSTCCYWAPSPRHSRRPRQLLAKTHARLRNQRRSVKSSPGPAVSSGLQQARSLPHDAKSCAHGAPRKKRIYSCIRIVSSPGSWSSADPPGYPSPSTELEDRRCAGPALRAYE